MTDQITIKEYVEIRKFLDENLIYGAELERSIPVPINTLRTALKSNADTTEFHKADFVCKTDCSVHGGNEIVLSGKKFDFRTLYQKLRLFEDVATKLNADPFHESCSTHLSFLTLHRIKIDGSFAKNIFQICRAFAPALCYMTGATKGFYSRQTIMQFADPRLNISPMEKHIGGVKNSTGKYSLCNISKTALWDMDNTTGIFVEFRSPDGIRIPSVVSALFFLHKAIIYNALKLSIKGVQSVESICGSEADWQHNKLLADDTIGKNITNNCTDMLRAQSKQLLRYLMPELKEMQDSDLFIPILEKLADKSISLRYTDNPNADLNKLNIEIDKEMLNGKRVKIKELNETEEKLLQELLSEVVVATSITSLKIMLANKYSCTQRTIENAFAGIEEQMGKRICIVEQQVMFR